MAQALDFCEIGERVLNKKDVIDFFNIQAAHWDEHMIRNEEIIDTILTNAQIEKGKDVLDVACGTGVLFPDYLSRNVNSVTAIAISPKMVEIAQKKFSQENIQIICADVETMDFSNEFDCIVVYNAFPHFGEPQRLIEKLSGLLREGGTLTVAHGMSRERIDQCHKGMAKEVSLGLMSEEELAKLFSKYLHVTLKISNDEMYQVVGKI